MLKVYLSGPMKGFENSNYPAFEKATDNLRHQGYYVYSPHEFMPAGQPSIAMLRKAFAAYSKFICEEADRIVLLPGWENSRGAKAERALGECCGLEIVEYQS